MENESIIKMLKPFNLNLYEAKSYLALLKKGELTAIEVAKISGVPRGRVYEVLNNLHNKGLCNLLSGRAKKYIAVSPEVFERQIEWKIKNNEKEIERKRREFSTELEKKRKEFECKIRQKVEREIEQKKLKFESQIDRKKLELVKLKENTDETVKILSEVYKEGRDKNNPLEYIEVLKDPYQAGRLFQKYFSECQHEAFGIVKQRVEHLSNPGLLKMLEEQVKDCKKHLKRGVSVKSIYEIFKDDKSNKELCTKLIDKFAIAGVKARVKVNLPMRLAVFDNRITMFTLIDPEIKDEKSLTVQIVRHPVFAQSFKVMFDAIWNQAEDYDEFKARANI